MKTINNFFEINDINHRFPELISISITLQECKLNNKECFQFFQTILQILLYVPNVSREYIYSFLMGIKIFKNLRIKLHHFRI